MTHAHSTSPLICEPCTPASATAAGVRACRTCGCTDERACMTDDGPCWWVEADLCSACTPEEEAAHGLPF